MKVISLNTSGVNTNYLEFYSERTPGSFFEKASDYFLSKTSDQEKKIIKNLPGEQFIRNRYTVLHRAFIKSEWFLIDEVKNYIKDNANVNIFTNKEDFEQKWIKTYEKDLVTYQTILNKELTKLKDVSYENLVNLFKETDYIFTKVLLDFLDENKEFISEYLAIYQNNISNPLFKIEKLLSFIEKNKTDIISLQELDESQILALDHIVEMERSQNRGGTVTYFKKELKLIEETDKPSINDQTVYLGNKDMLIVNTHLTSKSPERSDRNYIVQFEELISALSTEKRLVIVCGDFNHNIGANLKENRYLLMDMTFNYTCAKKRTAYQVQTSKVNKLDESIKDFMFVINNEQGRSWIQKNKANFVNVMMLNGEQFNINNLLPNIDHPSDHALLYTKIAYVQ